MADDILQDEFVKVHTKLPAINEPHKIPSWLYTTAKNQIVDYYRTKVDYGEFTEDIVNRPMETDGAQKVVGELSLGPQGEQACGCFSSCCVPNPDFNPVDASKALGYSGEDLASVPDGANMGLGCGNP